MLHPATMGELHQPLRQFLRDACAGRAVQLHGRIGGALTTGGVFERYPNLRVAFFECSAEWISVLDAPLDDDYRRMKNGFTPKITRKPSEYLKKNCYVTCEADERLLALALEEFNEDRVLLASDYPHFDSEYPGTVHELQERTDISDKQKQKILCENAKEFLRV
jgi:predicted TIM-barrel fold metal-dependent hydrolase